MATLSTSLNITFDNGIQPKTVYAGVLNKKGAVNKAWKKRWFVLYESRTLAYYASQNDIVNCKPPINRIDLSKITAIRVVNKPVTKPKTPNRRQTYSLNKSQSIGSLFIRAKHKPKLTVNGYNFDADRSLTSISIGDVPDATNYPPSLEMPFSTQFSFELVSPKRTYTLCCNHAASFNEWIDNLESAVFGKKVYKGWMMKQGERRKTWKKRWFIIFNTKEMRYYEDDKREKPKGSIFLTDLLTMRLIPDGAKYEQGNIVELHTPQRIWVLSAESKQNRTLWWKRIASMIGECHQMEAIYEDHLFTYNTDTHSWIYKYFALDMTQLYEFDKIEDCERYRNCTYFNQELYAIDTEKYVQNTIHLTMHPMIKRIQRDDIEFTTLQKQNVFKIETDIASFYFASDHEVQIDRWVTAFNKLMKLRQEKKKSQENNAKTPIKHRIIHHITDVLNEATQQDANHPYFIDDTSTDEDQIPVMNTQIVTFPSHLKSKTLPNLPNDEIHAMSAEPFQSYTHSGGHKHQRHYPSMDIKVRKTPMRRRQRRRTLVAKIPDMTIVSALLALGFTSVNACKRAALAVNNMSCEMAASWLWTNMERPEIHEALVYSDDEETMRMDELDDDAYYAHEYKQYYADIMEDDEFKICSDEDDDDDDDRESENEMEYLTEIEMKQIEDIPEYGVKADTFFKYKLWNKALKYYSLALDKDVKDRNRLIYGNDVKNECVYKWYCYRSECYRRLKRYPEAVRDTMSWMEMVFKDKSFEFVEGCEIASGIWMDLRRFAAAKIPIEKGLRINPNNRLLLHRLKTVHREIAKELAYIALEIDRKHLELTVDIEEKCDAELANDSELHDICSGWLALIGGDRITSKELFRESQTQKDNVGHISSDRCAQRLVFVMRVYGTWCSKVTQTDATEFVSMYDILSMLHAYGIHQLLNDNLHVFEVHMRNIRNNWLKLKCSDCFSKEIVHKIEARHFRNKSVIDSDNEMRTQLYFGYNGSTDIVTFEILDNIYYFIFYSDCVVFDDEHMNSLNFKLSSFVTNHRNYIKQIKPNGYREVYGKYISGCDTNMLSSIDIGTNHNTDNDNDNPKYETLKQELLENKVCCVSRLEWNDVLCKAKWYKKTYKATNRNWKAMAMNEAYLNDEYGIKADQPISLTHLCVLLLYTNNMKLRHRFFQRTVSKQEIANFNLLLQHCILFYSKPISSDMRLYHAISCTTASSSSKPILFNEYILNCLGVTSLTKYYSVAMMSKYDLVLELKRRDSTCVYHLDATYLSDRAFEGECIVSNIPLSICNVYDSSCFDYDIYMNSLLLFSKMIGGEYMDSYVLHKIVECMDCLTGRNSMLATPKYIQSMFNYLISQTPHLFLIKSQYEHVSDDIWSRLLTIDKENTYRFGDFLSFWKSKSLKSANFVNEYVWNEEFDAFLCLKKNEELIGPQLFYPLKQDNVVFIPMCKRLNSKLNKYVSEFGIKCKRFPHNKSTMYVQWNLFCPKAQYIMCRNVYFTKKDNYQSITLPIELMKQINAFQFQIALRILNIT